MEGSQRCRLYFRETLHVSVIKIATFKDKFAKDLKKKSRSVARKSSDSRKFKSLM